MSGQLHSSALKGVRHSRCVVIGLLLFASQLTSAKTAEKPSPTLRQVAVDVVVTNETGQFIDGLAANDFQIFENRKKQRINSFNTHIQLHNSEFLTVSVPPNTFTNRNSYAPDSINVILLDQLNTSFENQELARRAIISYMASNPPGAAFAIFTLRNDDPACLPFNYAQRSFGVTQGVVGGFEENCLVRGRLLMVQGITQDRKRLLAALDSKLAQPHVTLVRNAPIYQSKIDVYPDGVPEVTDSSMSALSDIGEFVHDLPGRKSLIWMSDSFDAEPIAQSVAVWFAGKFKGWKRTDPFASIQMLHLTADRFAEARVALYIADLSGRYKDVEVKRACPTVYEDIGAAMWAALNNGPAHITKQSEEWSCNQHFMKLSYLASHSGGQAFHGTNTAKDAIQRAVLDGSQYYTLIYSPTNTKFDGNVRNIRIALAQKNYRLAYRRAYFADDPSALYPPEPGTSQDVFVPMRAGFSQMLAVRVSGLYAPQKNKEKAFVAASQYGVPESNDIAFTAHIEPVGGFEQATPEEMKGLQDNASFISERTQDAMIAVRDQKQWRRKHMAVLDELPPSKPVFLQPYSVDYAINVKQFASSASEITKNAVQLDAAIVAYDALGKQVVALKEAVEGTIRRSGSGVPQEPEFHFQQQIRIPDRVAFLRFVIHDVVNNRTGSLEVPLWAITSPYRRKILPLPALRD